MTIFSDNPYDRRMERLMMTVPNFAPRGVGFRFTEAQLFITTTVATPTEILTATMRQIRCPPFRKRFNEYIESEEKPMTYINEKHRARFELAAKNISKAKDLTLGTKHITVSDLSDADLVPPMLFRTICNAMAIRRFGLAAIKENCHD